MAPRRYIFRRARRGANPTTVLVLLLMVVSVLLVNRSIERGAIQPLFMPTPTATRVANSYVLEARTHFDAGALDASIAAFQNALEVEPNNGALYAELARVLTYSSAMVTTDQEREARLLQAMDVANRGAQCAPPGGQPTPTANPTPTPAGDGNTADTSHTPPNWDAYLGLECVSEDSTAHAVRAFTLDWLATYARDTLLDEAGGNDLMSEADLAITRAKVLDETNLQALIYYAEIMVDFRRYNEAESAILQALQISPNQWELHRVYGLYLENQAAYADAIREFETALQLAPNMTFLYIKLGQSYRLQGMRAAPESIEQMEAFTKALEYFEKAANLNEQLGIKDPYPYLGIGYTYAQMGEFFIASRNMSKALSFNPYSAKVYGDLGMVARQGKNYELGVSALRCAVRGCDAKTSCSVRQCDEETEAPIVIQGLALTPNTVGYYFTYAALLAGMYVPTNPERADYCREALEVIAEVRAVPRFNEEPVYDNIMKESEAICASYGITAASPGRP